MIRVAALVILLLAVALTIGCKGDEEEEATATSSPAATATASPEATPTPEATASPSGSQLEVDDAPLYLDASAVLPGFEQLDPHEEQLSNDDLGLGRDYSEVVVYLSEEPFQTTYMFMLVASGAIEKASLRAELRDEKYLEENLLAGFYEGVGSEGVEASVGWSDPVVGDAAKLVHLTATWMGVESEVEALIFVQEEGQEMAAVFVFSLWGPVGPPLVDTVTIGREISSRIASR